MAVETPTIAPATMVGAVELTVGDLERSLGYYRTAIGLDVLVRDDGRPSLGVGSTMTTIPLDLDDLVAAADGPFDGLPDGTIMGHVHLQVASVRDTVVFYRDVLGLSVTAQLGGQAVFLSAGGYHHHFGANTWNSARASPPPPGSAALRHGTIVLPDA